MALTRVTTNILKDSAVTAAKIPDSTVTTVKIADANVTAAKIADGNITTAKIPDANITAAKIADGNVTTSKIADGNVTSQKLSGTGRFTVATGVRTSGQSLGGDSGWNDHMSASFTCGVAQRIMIVATIGASYESGPVQGFMRILVDGGKVGYQWCAGKQSTANSAGSGSGCWYADVGAGAHTVMVQARNSAGGSTWITPYWSVDGEGANTLGVMYYA
jgi:hypothetical protein